MAFEILATADLNQAYFITPDFVFVPTTGTFYFGSNADTNLHSITTANPVPVSVINGGAGNAVYPLAHDATNNILYITTGTLVRKVALGGPSVSTLFDYVVAGDTNINCAILDVVNDVGWFQGNLKIFQVTLSTGSITASVNYPNNYQIGVLGQAGMIYHPNGSTALNLFTNEPQSGDPGKGGIAIEMLDLRLPSFFAGSFHDLGQSGGISSGNTDPLTSSVYDPVGNNVYIGLTDFDGANRARIIRMDEPNWNVETVLTLPGPDGANWFPGPMIVDSTGTFLYVACEDGAGVAKTVVFKIHLPSFTVRNGVVLDIVSSCQPILDEANNRLYVVGYLAATPTVIRRYEIDLAPFSGTDPNFSYTTIHNLGVDRCGQHNQAMIMDTSGAFAYVSRTSLTSGLVRKIDTTSWLSAGEVDFGVAGGGNIGPLAWDSVDDHIYVGCFTGLFSLTPSAMANDNVHVFTDMPYGIATFPADEFIGVFIQALGEFHWLDVVPADLGNQPISLTDGEGSQWMKPNDGTTTFGTFGYMVANGSNAGADPANLVKLSEDGSSGPFYFGLNDVTAKFSAGACTDNTNKILYFVTEDYNVQNAKLWKFDALNGLILGCTPLSLNNGDVGSSAVAIDETTQYVYIVRYNNSANQTIVGRVRIDDFVEVDTIPLNQASAMAAAVRNGTLYIYGGEGDPGNPGLGAISEIDVSPAAAPFQLIRTVDASDYLWNVNHAEVNAANGFMYVMNSGGDYQFRDLALNTFQPLHVYDNFPQAVMFGLDRAGGFAFIMNGGTIRKIDLSDFSNPLTFTYNTTTFGTNPQSVTYDPVTNTVWHSVSKNGSPFNNTLFKIDAATMLEIAHVTKTQHNNSWTPRIVLDPTNDAVVFARNRILGGNPTVEIFRWNISDFPNGEVIAPTIDNHFIANQECGVAINGKAYIPIYDVAGDFGKLYEYATSDVSQTGVESFSDFAASSITVSKDDVAQGYVYVGIGFSGASATVPLIRMNTSPFQRDGVVTFTGANSVWSGSSFGDGNGYFYALLHDTVNPQKLAYVQVGTIVDVPLPPTDLTITTGTTTQVTLVWTDNSNNETGFKIDRGTDGINFVEIDTVGPDVETYNAIGLTPATTYWFRVRAYNGNGNSDYTNYAAGTTKATPNPGFNLLRSSMLAQGLVTFGFEYSLFISPVTGRIYTVSRPFFGATTTSVLYEANQDTFSPLRRLSLGDNAAFNGGAPIVVDDVNGFIYTASQDSQLKVSLSTFQVLFSHLAGANGYAEGVGLDAAGGFVYYAVDSVFYKLNTADMTEVASCPIPSNVVQMLVDIPNGFAYLLTDPDVLTRVDLGTMAVDNTINFGPTVDYTEDATIDLVNGVIYAFGSELGAAALWRVTTATFTRIPGTTTFLPDETQPFVGFVDTGNNFLFAVSTTEGKIVQFTLTPFLRTTRIDITGSPVTNFYYQASKGLGNLGYALGSLGGYAGLVEFGLVGGETPPNAPTDAKITLAANTTLTLEWTSNSLDEDGFKIEQSTDGVIFNEIHQTGAAVESYVVPGLTQGTIYYFKVRAFNGGGNSNYTNITNGTTDKAPVSGFVFRRYGDAGPGSGNFYDFEIGTPPFAYITWQENGPGNLGHISEVNINVLARTRDANLGSVIPREMVVDPMNDRIYFISNAGLYRIVMSTFFAVDNNATGGHYLGVDFNGQFAYYMSNNEINKAQLSDLSVVDNYTFAPISPPYLTNVAWDFVNGYAYVLAIFTNPVYVSEVRRFTLSPLAFVDSITLTGYPNGFSSIQIDPLNNILYVGESGNPGPNVVVSIDIPTFTRIPGDVTLDPTLLDCTGSVIDAGNGFLYILDVNTGQLANLQVAQVILNPFSYGSFIVLPQGQSDMGLASSTLHGFINAGKLYVAGSGVNDGMFGDTEQFVFEINSSPVPVVPTPPTGLITTALDSSRMLLNWTPGTGELGYKIERSFNGVDFVEVANIAIQTNTFTDVALSPATQYYYRIRSYNNAGDSPYSNVANATLQSPPADSIVRPFPTDTADQDRNLPQDAVRVIWDVREVMRDAAGKLFTKRRSQIQPDFLDYLSSMETRLNTGITSSGVFLDSGLVNFILLQRDRAVEQFNLNTTPGDYEAGLVLSALSGLLE